MTEQGELESSDAVEVRCDVEGGSKITTIVPEGTRVQKGEEVCRFDTDQLQRTLNEQEVKWEQAEGKLRATKSELEVQRNKGLGEVAKAELDLTLAKLERDTYLEGEYQVEVDKRHSQLDLARKQLKEAESNLEFTRDLVTKGFAQLEQVRVAELNLQEKQSAVKQQIAELRLLEKFTKIKRQTELRAKADEAERSLARTKESNSAALEKSESELKSAQKTAALEKQQFERMKKQLDKCVVLAPQEGIVVYFRRPWDDGSAIRTGTQVHYQQQIFSLPDLNKMQVKVKIHESAIKKVAKAQPATMSVAALANTTLHGQVIKIGTLAQQDGWRGGAVKEYQIIVSIADLPADAGLKPGMTAEVKIHIRTLKDVVMVPLQAVTEVGEEYVCYVQSGNQLERRVVEVGASNERFMEIRSGLQPGDRVALDARVRAQGTSKSDGKPAAPTPTTPSTGQ